MKRTDIVEDSHDQIEDELLPEYHFDYTKARPNRFAKGIAAGSLVVVLEPELAQVFKTSDGVSRTGAAQPCPSWLYITEEIA